VAAERMGELARRHPAAKGIVRRALNQAAREVLLQQSSDWAFIMTTGTTVPYATRRFNEHTVRFTRLYEDLKAGHLDEDYVADLEDKDNIFPHVDYRIYAT
jgi:1,4-alpha-glucan branching enzyme